MILIGLGIYVLIEKKMVVAGKYTGHLYGFESPAYIIIAISLFMLAVFFSLALIQTELMKKICLWLFMLSLVTFGIGLFL